MNYPNHLFSGFCTWSQLLTELFFHPGAQLKRDYLLNLSISISGRKDIYGLVCRVVPLGDGVTVNEATA